MPDQLQLRGGTTAEHSTFTGASKEVTVDITKKTAVVHDGTTAGGIPLLRQDGSNSALALGSVGTPSLKWDANTGIYSPGEDQLAAATNGVERVKFGTTATEVVFNDTGVDYDFRIKGDTNANLFFVDASTDRIGIGTSSPGARLAIEAPGTMLVNLYDTTYAAELTIDSVASNVLRIRGGTGDGLTIHTGGSEKICIDSSGRLLVGTTSTSSTATIIAQGSNGGAAAPGIFRACHKTTPANDELFAYYLFGDSTHCDAAYIAAARDGGTWTSGTSHPTRLVFSTTPDSGSSPTERMRIKQDGRIWIGNTADVISSLTVFTVEGTRCIDAKSTGGAANQVVTFWNNATTGDNLFASLRTEASDTVRGTIDYNRAAGQVRYNVTSDRRLKSNIEPAASALDNLSALQVRAYKWAETDYQVNYGFVAQELNEVVPDAVKVGDDGEEVTDAWSVDTGKLVPLLTKALQEAIGEIESLKARLTAAGI